jgi:hypothetical protein
MKLKFKPSYAKHAAGHCTPRYINLEFLFAMRKNYRKEKGSILFSMFIEWEAELSVLILDEYLFRQIDAKRQAILY